jgi:thioredoxin-related protein
MLNTLFIALISLSIWVQDFNMAKQKAKEEKKNILMVFSGSDWCNNCMRLKKTVFETSEFISYSSENLILLEVDFPRDEKKLSKEKISENEKLADKYNPNGSFPMLVLLDAEGNVKGKKSGYINQGVKKYIQLFELWTE